MIARFEPGVIRASDGRVVFRDARGWSRYLAEAIELFAADTDVAFASHHWPTWGTNNIVGYLREQRDLYAFCTIRHCG